MHVNRTPYYYLDSETPDFEDNLKPIKVFVIGERKTGKSSLIKRIINNDFTLSYTQTKSIEIHRIKTVGDVQYQFIDIPPNTTHFPENVTASTGDAVILMMSIHSTLENSSRLWNNFFKRVACNLWIVYNSMYRCLPPKKEWFAVDLLENAGLIELLYNIQRKLRPIY